jgi:hypothetical protein
MLRSCQRGSTIGGGGTHRRGIVKMEMGLLDALSMISLWVRQTEEAFLEEITGGSSVKARLSRNGTDSSSFQKANAIF